jgi:hypothetical protein
LTDSQKDVIINNPSSEPVPASPDPQPAKPKRTRVSKDGRFDGRSALVQGFKEKKKRRPPRVDILPKHRKVLEELQKPENKGYLSKAMIAASYSRRYAETKSIALKGSRSFQALLDEHLPEDLVAVRHRELLNKRARRNVYDNKGNIIEYGVDDGPDTSAVTKAIEMAYKLRGVYSKDDAPKQATVTYNLFYKPGVQKSMKAFENQLIRQIYNEVDEDNTKTVEAIEGEGYVNDRGDQEDPEGGEE